MENDATSPQPFLPAEREKARVREGVNKCFQEKLQSFAVVLQRGVVLSAKCRRRPAFVMRGGFRAKEKLLKQFWCWRGTAHTHINVGVNEKAE
jgi:hypothetical protein